MLLVHALPHAIAPSIQVIELNFLYLAGGIVVVEYVCNFPGIGDAPSTAPVIVIALLTIGTNTFTDAVARVAIGVESREATSASVSDVTTTLGAR